MAGPSITVLGLREVQRALRQVEGGVDDLKAAHRDAARLVADAARVITPRRSGRLAASVRATGQQRAGVVRAGKKQVPYAGPIHFGWPARNIRPQPFIYDALDARRHEVLASYEKNLDRLIRKAGVNP